MILKQVIIPILNMQLVRQNGFNGGDLFRFIKIKKNNNFIYNH